MVEAVRLARGLVENDMNTADRSDRAARHRSPPSVRVPRAAAAARPAGAGRQPRPASVFALFERPNRMAVRPRALGRSCFLHWLRIAGRNQPSGTDAHDPAADGVFPRGLGQDRGRVRRSQGRALSEAGGAGGEGGLREWRTGSSALVGARRVIPGEGLRRLIGHALFKWRALFERYAEAGPSSVRAAPPRALAVQPRPRARSAPS